MGSAISLRGDFGGGTSATLARETKNAAQARRLLALASIYDFALGCGSVGRRHASDRTGSGDALQCARLPGWSDQWQGSRPDLAQWLWNDFRVPVSEQTLSREVRAMGYRKLAARPKHHEQDPQAIEEFKKTSPPQWRKSPTEPPKANEWKFAFKTKPVSARRTK
ncbi:winged helix-turn-helix protein [Rhizobium sullae]|uniref:Winged helix-turn-helix protein n=1 Tax=Rhizobium sullae TaxID=50338 RepID=A0A4R3Q9C8_RHISU|nr:winged helix-turn-helix protein [Rhizobium sullae]